MKKPLLLLSFFIVSCSSPGAPTPTSEPQFLEGLATVEAVEVIMLMSFPLQVHLHVSGYVADPCTGIDEIHSSRDGYNFAIEILTVREENVNCIQVIEPFEQNIPLDVYGLPAGDYQVDVNGVLTEFTFHQDNILQE